MDLSCLPLFAKPVPGESVASWLEATRVRMDMSPEEWLQIVGYLSEAESPGIGGEWIGLPPELGDVRSVRRRWRSTQEHRGLICLACIEASAVGRPFTLARWADARQFWCRTHRAVLLPGERFGFERLRQAPRLLLQQELVPLSEWVAQWMQGGAGVPPTECAWRADLVRACAVNWLPSSGPNAGASAYWELSEHRLMFGELSHNLSGLVQPAFRQLPPGNRVGVLLAAFRLWQILQTPARADMPRMPELTAEGWRWLSARSSCRSDEQRHEMALDMVDRLGKARRKHRRRTHRCH